LGLATGLFVLAFLMGTNTQMTREQAEVIVRDLGIRNKNLDQIGIFVNNLIPALEMFIPAGGVVIVAYSAFSTGEAFSAFAVFNPTLKSIFPPSLLLSPFSFLEIFAYALAMSKSGILAYRLITNPRLWKIYWKKELVHVSIEVGIVFLVLIIASVIEWQKLSQLNQLTQASK
jgi:hypothetical protein